MPAGIVVRNVGVKNGNGITRVDILYLIVAVELNAGGNGDSICQFLRDIDVVNVVVLLYKPFSVERSKA